MQLKIYLPVLGLAACAGFAAAETNPIQILTKAPLRFEPSDPASGNAAKFIARGARFHFEFSADQAILRSGKKDVRLSFDGANRAARIEGSQLLGSTTNLYLGNDPSKWRHAVPNYGRVEVAELYPGIDLAYYGNGGELEYDLTVNPGANPRTIRFRLDGSGLIQKHPVAYQTGPDGSRHLVASSYQKNADGSYGFRLGAYDRSRALVIDPVLVVAQYIAGTYENIAYGIGHDANGLVYIGGTTESTNLPLVGTPYQSTAGGGQDLFLAIVNPKLSGSAQVIYVTYIGGTLDETFGAMSVSATGDVFMTGSTESGNFPMVNAAQSTVGGTSGAADAFVLRLSSSQALTYSTYFGGSETDTGTAISVAPNGWIWIAGNTQSTDLPIAGSGFQDSLIGTQNMFIAGFDTANSGSATLLYAIYIGGTHWDEAYGVVAAADGTVWLAGGTYSPNIWIQGNATQGYPYQGLYGGDGDAYVAHINPALKGLNALLYSSFLGGSATDEATSLVLDPSGRVILSGYTLSSNFPVTSNAFQTKYGGNTDAFIAILDTVKGQLVYSTYFGGSEPDAAMDLKEDSTGALYVSGYTESAGLPSTSGALQSRYDDSVDAFGLKLDPSKAGAAGIDYFTYLGSDGTQVAYGVDFDSSGNIYLAGYSSSNILSRLGGPARPTVTGNWDAFVIGFAPGSSKPATVTSTAREHHRHVAAPVSPHR
ncbi:MAG: SBBP repeat-containing protein [Bryobacteraceae bacterium]